MLLGPEQRSVGAPQGLVARRRGLEVAQSDRHRRAQPVAQRGLGHGAARAVGAQQGLMAIALDEDDAVGVGAHPRQDVLLAHGAAQEGADLGQDLIGGVEAGAVVELAEVVDVDEGDGQRTVVALGASDLLGQALAEGAVVGQAGEPVDGRLGVEARAILGVGDGRGDEVGVVGQALLGAGCEPARLRRPDDQGAPERGGGVHGRRQAHAARLAVGHRARGRLAVAQAREQAAGDDLARGGGVDGPGLVV